MDGDNNRKSKSNIAIISMCKYDENLSAFEAYFDFICIQCWGLYVFCYSHLENGIDSTI